MKTQKVSEATLSKVILLNATLAIFNNTAEAQTTLGIWGPILQSLCIWVFAVEILHRVHTEGWRNFKDSKTNLFELGLSIVLIPALATPWLSKETALAFLSVSLLKTGAMGKTSRRMRAFRIWLKPARESAWKTLKSILIFLAALCALLIVICTLASGLLGPLYPEQFGDFGKSLSTLMGTGADTQWRMPVIFGTILLLLWIGTGLAAFQMTAKRHEETEKLLRDLHGELIHLHDQLRADLKLGLSKGSPKKEEEE